jgi:ATP/maltotriose-dependent transcriptional regulator MalT
MGYRELGLNILQITWHHPACKHETKECARQIQRENDIEWHADEADPAAAAQATAQSVAGLDELITTVQTELATPYTCSGNALTGTKGASAAGTTVRAPLGASAAVLVEPLTEREQEVLELVADGLTNKEIADKLIISAGTVKWYTGQIYGKLGVNKRTQAVARARELALLN